MQLFKILLYTISIIVLITNVNAKETIKYTEGEVLRIHDCASGEIHCGKILVGAARVDQNTIQWVGTPKKEIGKFCGKEKVANGVLVCNDDTIPIAGPVEENVQDILESVYISIGSKHFGITGNKLYGANTEGNSNKWILDSTALAKILIEGTTNTPSIGMYLAHTEVGEFSEDIFYQLSSTRNNGFTATHTTIEKVLKGESVLDGSGDNTIITLKVNVDDKYTSSDCIEIIGCKEIIIPVGNIVNFTVNTNINQQLLQNAGLDANLHKHTKIKVFVHEVNDVCPGSTKEFSKHPTVTNIDDYYDYLNGSMPTVMEIGCNRRIYSYLMSVDKDYTVLTSTNLKDFGEGGYIDYTFYVEGHYDILNPEKTIGWAGKGYQTYRIRTSKVEETVEETNVTLQIEGNGTVKDDLNKINCTTNSGINTCNAKFSSGTTITLEAAPNDGFKFEKWSDSCKNGILNITTNDITCKATFIEVPLLEAKFSVNKITGTAPLTMELDTSASTVTNEDITYTWKNDGNNIIPSQIDENLYLFNLETEGTYKLSLEITDSSGQTVTTEEEDKIIIELKDLPNNLMVSPIELEEGLLKSLVGEKITLGDSTLILKSIPSGIDNENIVFLDLPPTACFTVETLVAGYAPFEEVILNASCSFDLESGLSYDWSLPNEAECTEFNSGICTTAFNTVGNHEITLTITDNNGNTSKITSNILVAPPLQQTMSVYNISGLKGRVSGSRI